MELDHEAWMRRAIEIGRTNPIAPFGAVIVDTTGAPVELATGVNDSRRDPTLHGEIACIQNAAATCDRQRFHHCVLYTTAEPCPMCAAACIWSGFAQIIYGTSVPRLAEMGWRQIDLRSHELTSRAGWDEARVLGGVLSETCDALFEHAITLH